MRKYSFIYLLLILLITLIPNIKVDAKEYASYGFLACHKPGSDAQYVWSDFNSCSYSDPNTSIHDGYLKFEVDDNGNVTLTSFQELGYELDGDTPDCDSSNIKCSDGICKCKSYEIDVTRLEEYYKDKKSFPDLITCQEKGGDYVIYSSNIVSSDKPDIREKQAGYDGTIAGDYSKVVLSKDLSNDRLYSNCPGYHKLIEEIKKINKNYGDNSSAEKDAIKEVREICNIIKTNTANNERYTDDICFKRCMQLDADIARINEDAFTETNSCGLGQDLVAWLLRILKIVRYILPVLVIALSIAEYIGAISSSSDDAMKKAGKRFSMRLFILILVFLIPSILQLIFNIFNIDGLSSSDPYCLK